MKLSPRRYPGAVSWVRKKMGKVLLASYSQEIIFLPNHKHANECGTGYLRIASQGLSCPFLKTLAAVFSDPTHRPWVSEDGPNANNFRSLKNLDETRVKIFLNFSRRHLITHTYFLNLLIWTTRITNRMIKKCGNLPFSQGP